VKGGDGEGVRPPRILPNPAGGDGVDVTESPLRSAREGKTKSKVVDDTHPGALLGRSEMGRSAEAHMEEYVACPSLARRPVLLMSRTVGGLRRSMFASGRFGSAPGKFCVCGAAAVGGVRKRRGGVNALAAPSGPKV